MLSSNYFGVDACGIVKCGDIFIVAISCFVLQLFEDYFSLYFISDRYACSDVQIVFFISNRIVELLFEISNRIE